MAYEQHFAIRQKTLDSAQWLDVKGADLPIPCDMVVIDNASGITVLIRTDPGNALSERALVSGQQYVIGQLSTPPSGAPRFPAGGGPVCALKPASGNPQVFIESCR